MSEKRTSRITYGRFDKISGDMIGQTTMPIKYIDTFEFDPNFDWIRLAGKVDKISKWYLTSDGHVEQKYTFGDFDKISILGNGIDVATLEDVPAGTDMLISTPTGQETHGILDGSIEISSEIPWEYTIELEAPHFVRKTFRIVAT